MSKIIYEYPLNERIRTFLRLEHLFHRADYFALNRTSSDCHNYCLTAVEITDLLERNDLRSEITKEITKQIKFLHSLMQSSNVNRSLLENTILSLENNLEDLRQKDWRLTKKLREDEILSEIRKRAALTTAVCGFDSPIFFNWVSQDRCIRDKKITLWQNEIMAVKTSIKIILDIIRDGALFENRVAETGFFQQSLSEPYQLVRVLLPENETIFPEISGDKHRVNIRFFDNNSSSSDANYNIKPELLKSKVDFELSFNGV